MFNEDMTIESFDPELSKAIKRARFLALMPYVSL